MLETFCQKLHVDQRFEATGGRMYRLFVLRNDNSGRFGGHALIRLWAVLCCFGIGASAQSTSPALNANAPFSIRATHLLGFRNTKNNCKGILSIQDNKLQFHQSGKPVAEVDIASVRHVFLGEESMQLGGVPMKIGKAAAPFGGGRVVSLFAHAKYDTLAFEYVDSNGGVHGALFQLRKGQAEPVRNEVVTRGAYSGPGEEQASKQSTAEVTHEDK
jgi:hypothetical protein